MKHLNVMLAILIPLSVSIGLVYYIMQDEDTEGPNIEVITQNLSVSTNSYANILVNVSDESDIFKVYIILGENKYEMENIGNNQYNYSFMPKSDLDYQIEAVDVYFNKRKSKKYRITLEEALYANEKFAAYSISFGKVKFINCTINKLSFYGNSNLTLVNSTVYDLRYFNLEDNISFVNKTDQIDSFETSNLGISNSTIYNWSIKFNSEVETFNFSFKEIISCGSLEIESSYIEILRYCNLESNCVFRNFSDTIYNFDEDNLKINNSEIEYIYVSSQENITIDISNSHIAIFNSSIYRIRLFGNATVGLSDTTYSDIYNQKNNTIEISSIYDLEPLTGYRVTLEDSNHKYYADIGRSGRVKFLNIQNGTYDIYAYLEDSAALLKNNYEINQSQSLEIRPWVESGDEVYVTYIGRYTNGTVFESSFDDIKLQVKYSLFSFTQDISGAIDGFYSAVNGMKLGQTKVASILPEDAYGLWDPEYLVNRSRDYYQDNYAPLTVGKEVPDSEDVFSRNGTITYIGNDNLEIDFNHPMANKTLVFTIKIIGIVKNESTS